MRNNLLFLILWSSAILFAACKKGAATEPSIVETVKAEMACGSQQMVE